MWGVVCGVWGVGYGVECRVGGFARLLVWAAAAAAAVVVVVGGGGGGGGRWCMVLTW